MLHERGGPVSPRILVEFFIVFPFTLKSVQFMSGVFPLIVGAFSDAMEKLELNFSFAETEFWIVFTLSILSAFILSGVFSLFDDLLITEVILEFELTFSFAFVTSEFSLYFLMVREHETMYFTGCYYHATYAFQSESTLHSCLNVEELKTGAISET